MSFESRFLYTLGRFSTAVIQLASGLYRNNSFFAAFAFVDTKNDPPGSKNNSGLQYSINVIIIVHLSRRLENLYSANNFYKPLAASASS